MMVIFSPHAFASVLVAGVFLINCQGSHPHVYAAFHPGSISTAGSNTKRRRFILNSRCRFGNRHSYSHNSGNSYSNSHIHSYLHESIIQRWRAGSGFGFRSGYGQKMMKTGEEFNDPIENYDSIKDNSNSNIENHNDDNNSFASEDDGSKIIGNNTKSNSNSKSFDLEAPNVKTIISFAIPAIGIWLCGPLLSLIDTSAVGLLSGTAQQAALNPAITITEDGALLLSFMYTATTSLVAAAHEYDRTNTTEDSDKSLTRVTIITALQLAVIVGILFGVGLGASSSYLTKSLIGKGQLLQSESNNEVLSAATSYVNIRALGMPAAVVIGSAQSACLGMKDIRSPLIVMVVAAFINLLGDFIFVQRGGAAGAAWATVVSQYAALIMFLKWLRMEKVSSSSNKSQEREIQSNESSFDDNGNVSDTMKKNTKNFSTRGILRDHFHYRDLLRLPTSKVTAKKFWPYVIPVTTTAIGRVSGYVAMSHVVSSALGTVDMAAQQIVLAFFLCFIPMCDSLNLTAQSFVPGIFEYKGSAKLRNKVMRETVNSFLKAGSIFGIVLMAVVSCIPLVSSFFSRDPNVILSVNSTTKYLSFFALLSGVVCSSEGLLLGQKDLKFLSNTFTAFFFIVPYLLLRLKGAALRGVQGIGLATIWRVFTFYQAVRCILWLWRLRYLSIRNENEEKVTESRISS